MSVFLCLFSFVFLKHNKGHVGGGTSSKGPIGGTSSKGPIVRLLFLPSLLLCYSSSSSWNCLAAYVPIQGHINWYQSTDPATWRTTHLSQSSTTPCKSYERHRIGNNCCQQSSSTNTRRWIANTNKFSKNCGKMEKNHQYARQALNQKEGSSEERFDWIFLASKGAIQLGGFTGQSNFLVTIKPH